MANGGQYPDFGNVHYSAEGYFEQLKNLVIDTAPEFKYSAPEIKQPTEES